MQFIVTDKYLFNISRQATLGVILPRHRHANPAFSTNMLSHMVDG